MAGTSGDTGQPNVHAAWRMAQAATAARAYQPNPKLAALAVGGSVGSGLADIVLLAEAHARADLAAFREELAGCRRAIGPPPG